MVAQTQKLIIMKSSEIFNNLWASAREAHLEGFFNFSGAFAELLGRKVLKENKYCFLSSTQGGAEFIIIGDCLQLESGMTYIPDEDSRKGSIVTILLMWGMDSNYLEDLTTWGHETCSYKVEEVPYEVLNHLNMETESNYWTLFDSVTHFKATGSWEQCE